MSPDFSKNTTQPSILIAFGGNALDVRTGPNLHQKEEFIVARRSMEQVVDLLEAGYERIVVTHGNGPQVGRIFLQQELTKDEFSRQVTLDVCVADSQGRIGYILQNVFDNICFKRKINKKTSTVVTQVIVDKDDPAFSAPTKFIGTFYTKSQALNLEQERGWVMKEDVGRGWRRVVPSPMPKEIIEKKLFRTLLSMGFIAIGAGGGGIPVYRKPDGEIRGIEAVIDKDRTSALLACDIGIDIFVILTEADHIYIDYKKPTEKALGLVHLSELDSYVKSGQFPDGSMGPKVGAAMSFVRNTGKKAIIANLFKLKDALDGKTGTTIIP